MALSRKATASASVAKTCGVTGRPLSQTTNFCAAIADAPFEIEVHLERDGRSTQHWRMTLDAVPASGTVAVPLFPVREIVAVTAFGSEGEASTVPAGDYAADLGFAEAAR